MKKSVLGVMCAFLVPVTVFAAGNDVLVRAESMEGAIPRGAQRVPVLMLHIQTPCRGPVDLYGVLVKHRGQGDIRDITQLYAYYNGRRVSRAATGLRSDGTARIQLDEVQLPSCKDDIEVQIVADFAQNAAIAGEHRFVIDQAEHILASAPLVLEAVKTQTGLRSVGRAVGTITVDFLPLTNSVTYGDKRTVARVRLSVSGERNQQISAITFTNNGSASRTDLQNLYVASTRGERLTNIEPSMDGDRVRLVFDKPLIIKRNESRLFSLVANVRSSRRRTIRFMVDEPVDVEAEPAR